MKKIFNKNNLKSIILVVAAIVVVILIIFVNKNEEILLNYDLEVINGVDIYTVDSKSYIESETETDLIKIDVKDNGIIIAELYPDIAPKTVANFKKLVSEGYYNGLIFHRVIDGFMIQTGDPTGTGSGGSEETIYGEFSENGFTNNLQHTKGVLSMARRGAEVDTDETRNSASSQFFIVQTTSPHLDGKYAAFGKVVSGLDLVDVIAQTTTDNNDKPIIDVIINSITFANEYNVNESGE